MRDLCLTFDIRQNQFSMNAKGQLARCVTSSKQTSANLHKAGRDEKKIVDWIKVLNKDEWSPALHTTNFLVFQWLSIYALCN